MSSMRTFQTVSRMSSSHTHSTHAIPLLCNLTWNSTCYHSQQNSSKNIPHQQKRTFRSTAAVYRKKSFYDVLGLTQSATKEEIKSKYREMAKKCHPDLNQDDKNAEKKFREITEAYEVLESDSKRKQYDAYGGQGTDNFEDMAQQQQYHRGESNFDQGFGFGFEGGDIFEMFHEMDRKQRGRVGKDVDVKLKLTFLEAINGCTKEVRYSTGGGNNGKFTRGKKNNEAKFKTVDIKVPAGVDTGMTITMEGQGCAAQQGNHTGNLNLEITVEKDAYFRREKSDVHSDLHISIDQAILGSNADVRTLDGAVSMKINPGTQPGATFSITGKGVKKVNSSASKRGNHYVKIIVNIPVEITARQKELMEMFAAERISEENKRSGKSGSSGNSGNSSGGSGGNGKQKYKDDYDLYDDDLPGFSA